jgi:fumarylacetoacetase
MTIDVTHDPRRRSWVESAQNHAWFPVQNLPYGIFSPADGNARAGVAIGDEILDLAGVAGQAELLPMAASAAVTGTTDATLNAVFALPARERRLLRGALSDLLSDEQYRERLAPLLHSAADCRVHLPAVIGDYSDFYVGIQHATNFGSYYRPESPLTSNYKHLPIGYHGRASSIRPSGTPVTRPSGQIAGKEQAPAFGRSRELDYEMELGVWIGPGNELGRPISMADTRDHIVGLCLLNDWSARDIQHWERLPLGPFLGKSFHTSISPWVVTIEALEPYRIAPRPRAAGDPSPLSYLQDEMDANQGQYAITLEVFLQTARMREDRRPPVRLSRVEATEMYWTIAQMVAHQTSNGCNLRPGDLLGTGTLSGATRESRGSLFEISWGGTQPLTLPNGERRTFLEDGDEVIFQGSAESAGHVPIGFGQCRAAIGTGAAAPTSASSHTFG